MRIFLVFFFLFCLLASPALAEDAPASPPIAEASLDKPHMEKEELFKWVETTVTEAMTFNYPSYQRDLQKTSKNFTKSGWEAFTAELQKSHILDSVWEFEQAVIAELESEPKLIQSGVLNGRYQWTLLIYLKVGPQTGKKESRSFRIIVERSPRPDDAARVAIAEWVSETQ